MIDSSTDHHAEEIAGSWWVFLLTGILNLVLGFVVLSFERSSLLVVSILLGLSLLATGISWTVRAFTGARDLRWLYVVGAALSLVGAIVVFAYPDETIRVLGLLLGWFLLLAGLVDVIAALVNREREHWWVGLLVGLAMFVLGVWSTGEDERSVFLVLTIVGIACVIRGVADLFAAFALRRVKHELAG